MKYETTRRRPVITSGMLLYPASHSTLVVVVVLVRNLIPEHSHFALGHALFLYLQEWITGCANTRRKRTADLNEFCTFILEKHPHATIDNITRPNIDLWLETLRKKGLKPATLAAKVNSLNAFLKALHDNYEWRGVRKLKEPTVTKHEFKGLSASELTSFLDVLDNHKARDMFNVVRNKFALKTLLYAGLRSNELLSTTFAQLSDDTRYLLDVRCKGDKYRDIYLCDRIQPILTTYNAIRHDTLCDRDALYESGSLSYRGRYPLVISLWYAVPGTPESYHWSPESLRRVCADLMAQANIPKPLRHPHTLRHCFGKTLCDKKGVRLAAHALGHSSIQTTMRYTTPAQHELEQALDDDNNSDT